MSNRLAFGRTKLDLHWQCIGQFIRGLHTTVAFIKDFAPDYSSFNYFISAPLAPGVFSINLATVNDPARHVQYGFETVGPNVWVTDVAQYGSIQITAVRNRPVPL